VIIIEPYLREEVSLSRAAEMTGLDIKGFKSLLRARGLKLRSFVGTEEAISRERGSL
jgi:predicted HTH domain antitoxin